MHFNKIEEDIINFWDKYKLQDKIIKSRKNGIKWEFLDGPPFCNNVPHHGHLLVSSIKDTIAKFKTQQGYQINYQLGFDCHGLPLEQEAEKKVGKTTPNDSIKKLTEFNNECRNIISNCSEDWYSILGRLGRQFDKSQTYFTSSLPYMKSLWWAFKQLWDKKLIYLSKKVMPYSSLLETPLSNFEANSNYQERTDISVYVKFQIKNSDEKLLIWTTTPWSLFANQGICVNAELNYCLVEYFNDKLWLCEDTLDRVLTNYIKLKTIKGKEFEGLEYLPIFPIKNWNNYKVHTDSYVDSATGTGLVHLAPIFGEDDMRVMKKTGYTIIGK
jgi:isoleucyl-tRNA synthetase